MGNKQSFQAQLNQNKGFRRQKKGAVETIDAKGRWLDMRDKLVTYPSFREEYLRHTGIVLKLGTEAADVFLDTAVVISVFQAPYLFQKRAMRKYSAVISYQL